MEEHYSYFDMNLIRSDLNLLQEDRKKGKELAKSGKIEIDEVNTGDIDQEQGY